MTPTFKHERVLGIASNRRLPDDFLSRLGGSDRIGEVLHTSDHLWSAPELLALLSPLPPKFKLGMSALDTNATMIRQLSFELKILAKEQKSRLAFILPAEGQSQLNTAQVLFNKLHYKPNMEITIFQQNEQWRLIRTIDVQNIPAYEQRDTSRPARDQVTGMLPPKLAQILLNLALGQNQKTKPVHIYDPFCGAGTILQEGWLRGFQTTGSDSNPDMVAASKTNLDWLARTYPVKPELRPTLFTHTIRQPLPGHFAQSFDAIVTEPFLGPALRTPLSGEQTSSAFADVRPLYLDFFKNMYPTLPLGGTIVFIFPAFRKRSAKMSFVSFPNPILDEIASIGYSQRALIPEAIADSYTGTSRGTIIYSRRDALVGREITLWEKTSLY